MAVHPKDKRSSNPRLQCSVCGQWKRLQTNDPDRPYRFYGGCGFTGGDHLAGKVGADGCREVCTDCCETECRKLAEARP